MRFLDKIKFTLLILLSLSTIFFAVGCKKPAEQETIYQTPTVEFEDYTYQPTFNTYNEVTLDGKLDDSIWQSQNKLSKKITIDGKVHDVEISTYFAEDGLVAYYKVSGSPVYFEQYRMPDHNSGLIIYLTDGENSKLEQGAWEICLDVGNVHGTKKYIKTASIDYKYNTFYAYMDKVVVVDGEVNTKSSNGYVAEIMFPWEFITTDGNMPKSVSMDAKIVYCKSNVGNRSALISVASNVIPSYKSTSPKDWMRFSKDGYLGDDTKISYTVNGGDGVQNGQVVVNGTFGKSVLLTTKADDGYALDALTVNGVKYQSPAVTFSPRQVEHLDIQVSFKPISGALRTITVTSGYNGCLYKEIPDGTLLTLTDSDSKDYVASALDGKVQLTLPNGSYKVSVDGFLQKTLTITQADVEYNLQLTKNLFTQKHDAINLEDTPTGSKISFTNVNNMGSTTYVSNKLNIDCSEIVALDYVIKLEVGKQIFSSLQYSSQDGTRLDPYCNFGSWDNNPFLIKQGSSTIAICDDKICTQTTSNGKTYLSLHFYQIIDGDTISLYTKTADNLTLICSNKLDDVVGSIRMVFTDFKGELYYEDFKILTGEEVLNNYKASVNVVKNDKADVVVDKGYVGLGQSFTITATPTSNNLNTSIVTKITVNGVETFATVNDKTLTATYLHVYGKMDKLDVEVQTIDVALDYKDVSISFVAKDMVGNIISLAEKRGTITGNVTKDFVATSDGCCTVSLVDGDYVLSIDGFLPTTFTVLGDSQVNLVLGQDVFLDDATGFNVGYNDTDGYNFTSTTAQSRLTFDAQKLPIKDGLKISFTYNGYVGNGVRQWVEFIFKSSNGKAIQAQILTWDNNFILKNIAGSREEISIGTFNKAISFDLYLLVVNGKVSLYNGLDQHLGTLEKASDTGKPLQEVSQVQIYYGFDNHDTWRITNLKVESYSA